MKMAKVCACIAAGLVSTLALADAANVCITFSTTGPDTYADGTTVADNEWYALVWLADGATFQGVTTQLEAVDSSNEVMLAAPLAKGGRCPLVMWQVDSAKAKTSGTYTVLMLDTRDSNGNPAGVDAVTGKPAVVYAMMKTSASVNANKNVVAIASQTGSGVVAGTKAMAAGDVGAELPVIEALEIVGENVKITVSGLVPGLTYRVVSGATPTAMTASDALVDQTSGEVFVPAADAAFFSIKAE